MGALTLKQVLIPESGLCWDSRSRWNSCLRETVVGGSSGPAPNVSSTSSSGKAVQASTGMGCMVFQLSEVHDVQFQDTLWRSEGAITGVHNHIWGVDPGLLLHHVVVHYLCVYTF